MESPVAVDALRADYKLEGDALLADYVQRYRSLIERLCRILLRDSTDAEDAAQQTFLLAYQSLLTGTRPHHPRAWLCTIARRECWAHDYRRRRERAVPQEEARTEPDPAERTVLRAELATINAGLEQLPARQRQAIVLREFAGLSYTQLAAALEVSESAAEALLVRARRNLREARLVLFLFPFPNSLRRILRLGSGHARTAVGVQAAKAVAVATLVTATVAASGSGVPAERAVSPSPSVAERAKPTPKPVARTPHRRTATHRPAVRRAQPVPAQARTAPPIAASVHVDSTTPAGRALTATGVPGPISPTLPSPSAAPQPSVRLSPPQPQTNRPHPSSPRPRATAPKHVTAPPAATTPTVTPPAPSTPTTTAPDPSATPPAPSTPTTTEPDPSATPAPPPADTTVTTPAPSTLTTIAPDPSATPPAPSTPTTTEPDPSATPAPSPADTTDTAPPASDEPTGGTPTGDGDTKPGIGNGDKNHDHVGNR
jgi:RNA polymerase sigma factor (sigma-70 family)